MGELANDDLLGPTKTKSFFLALVGMLAQTLKNAIKKLGPRLGFLKIFFQNPEVASLVAVSTCQKVTKAMGMGLFGCKKQH